MFRHQHDILHLLTKCHPSRTIRDRVTTISFLGWRPQHHNSTFVFVFRDLAHLGRSQSTYRPNCGEISQFMTEILLLPVSEHMLEFYFRFRFSRLHPWNYNMFASSSSCHSAAACRISSKADHPRQGYNIISVFQDGGHGIAILLPVSFLVTSLIYEGRSLPADQTSARFVNPWLRYYYFRFLKTNVCHVRILIPVFILGLRHHQHVILRLSAICHLNRTIYDRVMTSYPFFKMTITASQFYFGFRFFVTALI